MRRLSHPSLAISALVASVVAGGALLAVAIGLLATRNLLTAPAAAPAVASALGFAFVTVRLCRVVERLAGRRGRGDGEDERPGGGGGGGGPDPRRPRPPSDEPEWWPQFERDLRAHLEARERVPAHS